MWFVLIIMNKATIKMLKYIKKYDLPTETRYPKKNSVMTELLGSLFPYARKDIFFARSLMVNMKSSRDIPYSTSGNYRYWATELTDKLLKDKSRDLIKWMLPTIISILALALSILTFVVTILDNSPISVKILP